MSPEDQRRILELLNKMESAERRRVMATVQAFINWLSFAARLLYLKVKDEILFIWETIRGWFF
jgi:hypothetical protein